MAKTKEKTVGVRRVRTKEDRKRPSVWLRLKTEEAFKGIALFEPDPELKDNPGYLEYYDHFDKQANQYVPCASEKCPFCAANDNPSTRAMTVWYFPEAADVKDKIKIFTMNYSTIGDITDESEDEDGILGKLVRIKRLSDKGDYKVKVSGKSITAKELKAAMKLLETQLGEGGLDGIVLRQMKIQLERLKAVEALDDDDDDDDDDEVEEKPKSRKGKPAKDEDEDDDDDEDDDEDESEDDDDDSDDDDDETDDDDDDEDDDEDEDKPDDDDEEEAAVIEKAEYEVVKVQEKDEIFDLKNDEGKTKMWLGEGVEVDYDEVKKGAKVVVSAETDDEGDWIITDISVKAEKKPKGGKKDDKKKGGKKK